MIKFLSNIVKLLPAFEVSWPKNVRQFIATSEAGSDGAPDLEF